MRPFWLEQALSSEVAQECPPLRQSLETDVCIVGGGYTGLWTAIMLKERAPQTRVALIEADICGAGASGRNGGCVLSWATKYPTLHRLFGEEEAIRLVRESERSILAIGEFCHEHDIDADFRLDGTLFTATNRAQCGAMSPLVETTARHGINSFSRVEAARLQCLSGSRRHQEGWFSPNAATVHPAKLVRGLRRVALARGVEIFENTPMLGIEPGFPCRISTPQASVRADKAVIAINAWMARQFAEFRRAIAIVSSDMVITEPCPEGLADIGLTSGVSVLDSRIFVHYYHNTPDGRLMLGKGGNTFAFAGHIHKSFDRPSRYLGQLRESFNSFFPDLRHLRFDTSWNGPSDRSVTGLPFFGRLRGAPNIVYGLGYSGSGVGPSHMGGQILASLTLEADDAWSRSPLTRGPLGRFPVEPVRYLGSLMVRNAIRRKERAEDSGIAPRRLDRRLSRLAAAAGKSDKC